MPFQQHHKNTHHEDMEGGRNNVPITLPMVEVYLHPPWKHTSLQWAFSCVFLSWREILSISESEMSGFSISLPPGS